MNLDLRIPMGMMFSMTGAVLMAFGLAVRNRAGGTFSSAAVGPNLVWGVVLLVFGMIVLGMGRRGQGRIEERKRKKA
jgi:hypothetical protein